MRSFLHDHCIPEGGGVGGGGGREGERGFECVWLWTVRIGVAIPTPTEILKKEMTKLF